ncbi:MAG: hypothetical protein H0U49_09615 [Parachlamydiaceae bacterium]|nr:hypothetical protein [Parachlamydiaceae bacterium]
METQSPAKIFRQVPLLPIPEGNISKNHPDKLPEGPINEIFERKSANFSSQGSKKIQISKIRPEDVIFDAKVVTSVEEHFQPHTSPRERTLHINRRAKFQVERKNQILNSKKGNFFSSSDPLNKSNSKKMEGPFDLYLNNLIYELDNEQNFKNSLPERANKLGGGSLRESGELSFGAKKALRRKSEIMLSQASNNCDIHNTKINHKTNLSEIDKRETENRSYSINGKSQNFPFQNSKEELLLAYYTDYSKKLHKVFKRDCNISEELEEYLTIEKKRAHGLNSFLEKVWGKITKPAVSARIIEDRINGFVENVIGDFFKVKNNTFTNYTFVEMDMMNIHLSFLQNEGVTLQEIYSRSKLLTRIVKFYQEKNKLNSNWGIQLHTYLNKLSSIVSLSKDDIGLHTGKEISKYIKICDEVSEIHRIYKDSKSEFLERWVLASFGDSQKEIMGVLRVLRKWASNAAKQELIEYLWVKSFREARLEYVLGNFNEIVHHWYQDRNMNQSNISKITAREIAHSIKPEQINGITFDLITVNGKTFWDSDLFDPQKQKIGNKEFYTKLFAFFSGKTKVEKKHEIQAMFFIAAANEDCYDVPEVAEKHLPWLGLMRLTANSNWEYAEQYLRFLIPGIFALPYWTRCEPGIGCHILIDDNKHYQVVQVRKMAIFLRLDPNDEDSFATGEVQVSLTVCWSIQPTKQGWKGYLWIKDYDVVNGGHWKDLKQRMVNIMDVNPNKEKLAGVEFSTNYPFSKSECTLLYLQNDYVKRRSQSLSSLSRDSSFERISPSVSRNSIEEKVIIRC